MNIYGEEDFDSERDRLSTWVRELTLYCDFIQQDIPNLDLHKYVSLRLNMAKKCIQNAVSNLEVVKQMI